MENINFVILAAGKGTRMKNHLPKVLHKVCDIPLIGYVLNTAYKYKSKNIIAITSPDVAQVDAYIKKKYSKIKIIHQKERLGTGHAVRLALPNLPKKGVTIILYGDTPFISEETINQMIAKLNKASICVLGFETVNPTGYGRLVIDAKNNLTAIIEEKEATSKQKKITLCNSGVIGFNNKYIHEIINKIQNKNSKKEFYLTDAVSIAKLKKLKVDFVTVNQDEVIGINSQAERAEAEKIRQNYLRSKHMENGVILIAPETVYFSENCNIAVGVTIHPYCIFKGDVAIDEGSEVFAFSVIENSFVGKNVNIGPYARIRPETVLNEGARVGNFVEIKKSNIGKNSKINHLSYIGDSEVGDNVNIGAGTITCNYDGKNKFKTIIKEGAFIGSNSALVAPVVVGENAILGAGTTLFKDAPKNKTTINQMPIKTL